MYYILILYNQLNIMAKDRGKDKSTIRINLEVPIEDRVELYEKAKNVSRSASFAEAVRRALKLFIFILHSEKSGDTLFIRRKDGTEERVIIV
jgi:predicted lipid carrier protein YhbT